MRWTVPQRIPIGYGAVGVCGLQWNTVLGSCLFSSVCAIFVYTWGVQVVRYPNFFSGMEAGRNVKVVGGDVAVL